MKWLKRLGSFFLVTILVIVSAVYFLWMPSPQEPAYTLAKTWGTLGTAPGQFNEPTGITASGNEVFVSDGRNHRIQVFDLDGNALRQFGTEQLERPMNLTIANGEVFVADYFADQIKVFSLAGDYRRSIGKPGTGPGEFTIPGGVAVASNGDVYVAEFKTQRVQQLHADGSFVRQWGLTNEVGTFGGKLRYPTDVALAKDGTLFIADGYNDRVLAIGSDGNVQHKWGGPLAMNIFGSFNGWFATITGISVGPSGNVFVADFYNDRVQKFTSSGKFLNAFGIKSTGPTHTSIAVAEADDGSVFVADYANHQVQKWRPGNK
ncbi:MAG: 6-bladed beta-propeller [Gammaproteobacteria bacterium]|nr:6-bladed beta-propeller [Gammaproteobacteria bacterium]MCF6261396.1 6-bladed beta-propeller [Gammaproteobacteria bacterium]